jgi:hypothetical protein
MLGLLRRRFAAEARPGMEDLLKDLAERRSRLFPDKVRIPARKSKIFFGLSGLVAVWSIYTLRKAKDFMTMRALMVEEEGSIVEPFANALGELEAVNLDKRNFLILSDLFRERGGAEKVLDLLHRRFHRELVWVPNTVSSTMVLGGEGRSTKPPVTSLIARFEPVVPNLI